MHHRGPSVDPICITPLEAHTSLHTSAQALHLPVFLFNPLPVQRTRESSAAVVRSVREAKDLIHDFRRFEGVWQDVEEGMKDSELFV